VAFVSDFPFSTRGFVFWSSNSALKMMVFVIIYRCLQSRDLPSRDLSNAISRANAFSSTCVVFREFGLPRLDQVVCV